MCLSIEKCWLIRFQTSLNYYYPIRAKVCIATTLALFRYRLLHEQDGSKH